MYIKTFSHSINDSACFLQLSVLPLMKEVFVTIMSKILFYVFLMNFPFTI